MKKNLVSDKRMNELFDEVAKIDSLETKIKGDTLGGTIEYISKLKRFSVVEKCFMATILYSRFEKKKKLSSLIEAMVNMEKTIGSVTVIKK